MKLKILILSKNMVTVVLPVAKILVSLTPAKKAKVTLIQYTLEKMSTGTVPIII